MKILINAYACSPYHGSEPGMGWNFVHCLAHHHELHIITEKDEFKNDIERYFTEHPEEMPYYRFYYVKRLHLNRLRKVLPQSYYWTYAAWQRKALKLAMELDRKENFDVIHQLNMLGYREPGYLWKMGKPFVWGPMGNFNITPWRLLPVMGWYGTIYYAMRNIINWYQARHSARVRMAAEKASAIICAMEDDRKVVKKLFNKDAVVIPEVGLTAVPDSKTTMTERRVGEKLKVCWSGVHEPRKALPLLLEAMKYSEHANDMELHILGYGPCTQSWQRLSKRHNIGNIVWYGQTSRDDALSVMEQCHVFVITSLSDATTTVLLEALSLRLPVIALNHLGFAGVVNDSCGIKIDLDGVKQIEKDIAGSLDMLYENELYRQKLSCGAYKRAQEFSWIGKAKIIDKIYSDAADK